MSRWSGVSLTLSATSRTCRARGILRTTRQTDKRAALPQQTAGRKCYEEVAYILITWYEKISDLSGVSGISDVTLACYEEVSDKLRTCYEEVTRKLLPWNLALSAPLRTAVRVNV